MSISTYHKAQRDVHAHGCRTAGADEGQRHTDNWCDFQYHADVHDTVDKQHAEYAGTNEHAQLVLGAKAVIEDFQTQERQYQNDGDRADKPQCLSHLCKHKVVVNFRDRDIVFLAGMESHAEDLAIGERLQTAILLIFDVFRVCARVQQHQNTLFVSVSQQKVPHGDQRHRNGDQKRQGVLPGDLCGKKHSQEDHCKDNGSTIVALQCNEPCGDRAVYAQQQHVQRLVHVLLVLCQMQGKGKDKRQLQHLRGLKLDKAQIQPCLVVCAGALVSQRRKGEQCQDQGDGRGEKPEPDELVIIDGRQHQQAGHTQTAGEQLRPVIAGAHRADDVILPDGVQQDNAQGRAEQRRQNERLVQPPPVGEQGIHGLFPLGRFGLIESSHVVYFQKRGCVSRRCPSIFGRDCGTVRQLQCAASG